MGFLAFIGAFTLGLMALVVVVHIWNFLVRYSAGTLDIEHNISRIKHRLYVIEEHSELELKSLGDKDNMLTENLASALNRLDELEKKGSKK